MERSCQLDEQQRHDRHNEQREPGQNDPLVFHHRFRPEKSPYRPALFGRKGPQHGRREAPWRKKVNGCSKTQRYRLRKQPSRDHYFGVLSCLLGQVARLPTALPLTKGNRAVYQCSGVVRRSSARDSRRFTLLEITSGLPDLHGRVKAGPGVTAITPSLAETLECDWCWGARLHG